MIIDIIAVKSTIFWEEIMIFSQNNIFIFKNDFTLRIIFILYFDKALHLVKIDLCKATKDLDFFHKFWSFDFYGNPPPFVELKL